MGLLASELTAAVRAVLSVVRMTTGPRHRCYNRSAAPVVRAAPMFARHRCYEADSLQLGDGVAPVQGVSEPQALGLPAGSGSVLPGDRNHSGPPVVERGIS